MIKFDSIIGAVLLLVLLVVLAIPIVHDATIEKEYHDNAGTGTPYGTGAITIVKSGSTITANGEGATASNGLVLWNATSYLRNDTYYTYSGGVMESHSLSSSWTLSLSSSGYLRIYTESGYGSSYQYIERYSGSVPLGSTYHLKPTGSYVYIGSTASMSGDRIDKDSTIIGLAFSNGLTTVYGTAENGAAYTRTASGGLGEAHLSAEWSDDERCYTVTSFSGELNGSDVVPSMVFFPATYYTEEDKEGTAYDLLRVVPLIMAMGIVIAAAGFTRRKRYA